MRANKRKGTGAASGVIPRHLLTVILGAVVLAILINGLDFRTPPAYRIGDTARRTIRAVQSFTVKDREATRSREKRAVERAPVVIDFDLRIVGRLESDLRLAFSKARQSIVDHPGVEETRQRVRGQIPPSVGDAGFEAFWSGRFSPALEEQAVDLLRSVLDEPVAATRDLLLRYKSRGILLRDMVTGRRTLLDDLSVVKDLEQAGQALLEGRERLSEVPADRRGEAAEALRTWLAPNLNFDEEETRLAESAARQDVPPVLMQVRRGTIIVRAGQEVTPAIQPMLLALRHGREPAQSALRLLSLFVLTGLSLLALGRLLRLRRSPLSGAPDHFPAAVVILTGSLAVVQVVLWIGEVLTSGGGVLALDDYALTSYAAPYALGAILSTLLLGRRAALAHSLIFSSAVALAMGDPRFFVYALAVNLTAVFALEKFRERAVLARAGLAIGLVGLVTSLALLLSSGLLPRDFVVFIWVAAASLTGGLLAAMSASLALPVLESTFGLVTDIRLLELSNLNAPLLKRLAAEAPGTYHHSLMVGTLGEAAAEAIQANRLLVRVGAYYHDIGKLKNPECFVENQIYANKQESISPRPSSSRILAEHVQEGLAIAEEASLTREVREMIAQHHGTRLMSFFERKSGAADQTGDEGLGSFRYAGPKPQTREAAILMAADQSEATTRSLEDPSPDKIRSLIQRLIQADLEDGQYDESGLTIGDLQEVAKALQRVLTGLHHQRIEYPGFDREEGKEATALGSQRIQ